MTSAWRYWWKLGSSCNYKIVSDKTRQLNSWELTTARMNEYPGARVALPPAAEVVVDGTDVLGLPPGTVVCTGGVLVGAGAAVPWRHWE